MKKIVYIIPKPENESYYMKFGLVSMKTEIEIKDNIIAGVSIQRTISKQGKIKDSVYDADIVGDEFYFNDFTWRMVSKEEANDYCRAVYKLAKKRAKT